MIDHTQYVISAGKVATFAFCPTGKGGKIKNDCSPMSGGGGIKDVGVASKIRIKAAENAAKLSGVKISGPVSDVLGPVMKEFNDTLEKKYGDKATLVKVAIAASTAAATLGGLAEIGGKIGLVGSVAMMNPVASLVSLGIVAAGKIVRATGKLGNQLLLAPAVKLVADSTISKYTKIMKDSKAEFAGDSFDAETAAETELKRLYDTWWEVIKDHPEWMNSKEASFSHW